MSVNLKIKKEVFEPKLYPYLLDYSKRWEFYMGSAGSGKSYFITQKLIVRAINERVRIMVCRRYKNNLKQSCFSLFKEIIREWKLSPYVKINESDFVIRFLHNDSEIIFVGLDDEEKLLSINDIGAIFVEEVFQVPKSIVEQLDLRMRSKHVKNQQIILAWNPISKHSWLYDFTVTSPPTNSVFIHTTYKDNPFLSPEYIASLEELYTRNPQKARIYCDGEWGIESEGLVFQNWKIQDFNPMELAAAGLERRCGSDLGFVDPTTIVCSLYDRQNKKIYIYDEFYKRGCQLDEVYEAMKTMELSRQKLYMDCAEPRSIQFFQNKGINAVPCIKGADSVKARITFLQNHEIIILPSCVNCIMEFENFAYKKDKQNGEYKEEYEHEFSHAIDGLGYAYSDIYTNTRLRTLDKSILGL